MIQKKTLYKYEFNVAADEERGDDRIVERFENKCPYFMGQVGGDVCVDVGAHIGLFSLIASKLFKNVYAFEPIIENLILFNLNLFNNEISNASVSNLALWSMSSIQEICLSYNNIAGASFNWKRRKYKDEFNSGIEVERAVRTISFKELKKEFNLDKIDFLKLSVNQAEYIILDSITDDDFASIGALGIEYCLESPSSHMKIAKRLESFGFKTKINQETDYTGYILASR